MLKNIALLIFLSFILSACFIGSSHESLQFDTDPRILRDVWTGELQDYPTEGSQTRLSLSLSAKRISYSMYTFEGTAQLGENKFTVSGSVEGGSEQSYLETQTPAIRPVRTKATLQNETSNETITLYAEKVIKGPSLSGSAYFGINAEGQPYTFSLSKE